MDLNRKLQKSFFSSDRVKILLVVSDFKTICQCYLSEESNPSQQLCHLGLILIGGTWTSYLPWSFKMLM